jgi:putative tricarboxylic transport membrane protein
VGLAASPFLAPVAKLPGTYVAPVIFSVSLVGAYTTAGRRGDILIALIAGVAGYVLKRHGFSLIPIVLALFLGPVVENSLGQMLLTLGPASLVTRPLSLSILALGLVLFTVPLLRGRRQRRAGQAAADHGSKDPR